MNMMVEAEKLLQAVMKHRKKAKQNEAKGGRYTEYWRGVREEDEAIAAWISSAENFSDAEQVVRCRECKYAEPCPGAPLAFRCRLSGRTTMFDFYCGNGAFDQVEPVPEKDPRYFVDEHGTRCREWKHKPTLEEEAAPWEV